MTSLKDKVAIITGGAQGIGKATVSYFLKEGAKVAVWDIDEQKAASSLEQWKKAGYEVRFYAVNTADMAAVDTAAKAVASDFGAIHILINNAGITRDATLKKITMEQWKQVIDVNLTGVFNCTKMVAPYMIEAAWGRIVNASSVVGLQGNFGQTNYAATKAGVIGMTKVWARELGRKGITVNAVAPGFINTEMMRTIPEKVLDGFRAKTPLNRLGTVEEIAATYAFLCSEQAGYITGTTISVDGGVSI
ncbi:MAG: 3-oxoacyl-ACP reductase FabG [Bacteroidota bacterium]